MLSVCLIVAAEIEWGKTEGKHDDTGKKMEREFFPLRNSLVNSEKPFFTPKKKKKKKKKFKF